MSACLRAAAPLAALGLLLLAGCGVTCDHPLSDDETSVADVRLLGRWRARPEPDEDETPDQLWVGRAKDTKNTLEAVALEMDDDGHVEVRRLRLFATTVGAQRYLSVTAPEDGQPYLLVRYALEADRTLQLFLLREEAVARAIEADELAGTVETVKTETGGTAKKVHVTAPTEALRAWIEKNADAAFALDAPTVFEKLEGPAR